MVSERKRYLPSTKSKIRDDSASSQQSHITKKLFDKIAKYLRFSTPTKKGILAGMKVDYFNGTAAVDTLMNSNWAEFKGHESSKGHPVLFRNRIDCIDYFQALIDKNMIHRSYKVYKPKSNPEEKRKYKLEVHESQVFFDLGDDIYVWVYEPATLKQYVIGSLVVIVVIACCLFPLWPAKFRSITLYGSIGSAALLGVLLTLALIKYILFSLVWLATRGTIHFWFLPNLSEDVGFFESFVPMYEVKYPKSKRKKSVSSRTDSKSLQYQSQLEPIKEEESLTTSLANNKNEIENSNDDLDITNDDIHSDSKHSSEDYEILSASELEVNN